MWGKSHRIWVSLCCFVLLLGCQAEGQNGSIPTRMDTDGTYFSFSTRKDSGEKFIEIVDVDGRLIKRISGKRDYDDGHFGRTHFYFVELDRENDISIIFQCSKKGENCIRLLMMRGYIANPTELDNGDLLFQRSKRNVRGSEMSHTNFNFYLLRSNSSQAERLPTKVFLPSGPIHQLNGVIYFSADFGSQDYFGQTTPIDSDGNYSNRDDYILNINDGRALIYRKEDRLTGSHYVNSKYYYENRVVYMLGTMGGGRYIYHFCVVKYSMVQFCKKPDHPTTNPAFAGGKIYYAVRVRKSNNLKIISMILGDS